MRNFLVKQHVWSDDLAGAFIIVHVRQTEGVGDLQSVRDPEIIQRNLSIDSIHPFGRIRLDFAMDGPMKGGGP